MGNIPKNKKRSSRPAGHPSSPQPGAQPSATGYVGPQDISDVLSPERPIVAPPVAASAADDPYRLVGWGDASGIGGAQDVTCPSGQVALVKRPGVQGLIEAGVLQQMDSLTGLVESKHIRRVKGGGQEVDVASLMKEPEQLNEVMSVIDRVLTFVVLKPGLTLAWTESSSGTRTPVPDSDRQPGKVYTDQVEITDKMFIFNYAVGGTRNLERFRDQSEAAMASVDSGEPVEGAS